MTPEEALKHPWIAELKKKSAKEVRPKHRLRREAETSVEHENTRKRFFLNWSFFQKPFLLLFILKKNTVR